MDLSLSNLFFLFKQTIRAPRNSARLLIDANIPPSVAWSALILITVLSTLTSYLFSSVFLASTINPEAIIPASPFLIVAMQLTVALVLIMGVYAIGHMFNGEGSFNDVLIVMTWFQVVMFVVQLIQLILFFVLPPVGAFFSFISLALFFWLISHFIAEVHGFKSLILTLFMVIICMIIVGFILTYITMPFIMGFAG